MPPVICLLVEYLRTSSREIQNLIVMHHNVNHRSIAQIPEIQGQLAARSSVDSGVAALPRRFLEGLSDDELRVPIITSTDRKQIVPQMRGGREAKSVRTLLD